MLPDMHPQNPGLHGSPGLLMTPWAGLLGLSGTLGPAGIGEAGLPHAPTQLRVGLLQAFPTSTSVWSPSWGFSLPVLFQPPASLPPCGLSSILARLLHVAAQDFEQTNVKVARFKASHWVCQSRRGAVSPWEELQSRIAAIFGKSLQQPTLWGWKHAGHQQVRKHLEDRGWRWMSWGRQDSSQGSKLFR